MVFLKHPMYYNKQEMMTEMTSIIKRARMINKDNTLKKKTVEETIEVSWNAMLSLSFRKHSPFHRSTLWSGDRRRSSCSIQPPTSPTNEGLLCAHVHVFCLFLLGSSLLKTFLPKRGVVIPLVTLPFPVLGLKDTDGPLAPK